MFQKAVRRKVFLKLASTGPSGSGKTMGALLIAKGLIAHLPARTEVHKDGSVKSRVCVIDSENESASLYAHIFDFDTAVIHPPFTVQKYQTAFDQAVRGGYDVVVADSISHVWAGDGGLLEKKEGLDSGAQRNKFSNWGVITKDHEKFKTSFLQAQIHCICTMRSKTEYLMTESNGQQKITKAGMAPIQRDGLEYEFTTVFDFDMRNMATASKDRTRLFSTESAFKVTEETGKKIRAWLNEGVEAPAPTPVEEPSSEPQRQTNHRPQNNQNQTKNPPASRQQNTSSQPENFQLKAGQFWTENPQAFGNSVLNFGKHSGKMFKDIGSHELNRAMQYALTNSDPKSPPPKEFVALANFVLNWHESLLAIEFNIAEPPDEPSFIPPE